MSLTADTVAFQLLWPGELLQSVTVTIKVSWVGVVWGVEGQLLCSVAWRPSAVSHSHHQGPSEVLGWGGSPALGTGGQVSMSLTAVTVAPSFSGLGWGSSAAGGQVSMSLVFQLL